MKKRVCMHALRLVLLALGIFCAGMTVCAQETEAEAAQETEAETPETIEYESLGITVKNPGLWEGLKGYVMLYPLSSTSLVDDPEIFAAYLYYIPATKEDLKDEEKAAVLAAKMTEAGMFFAVNGDEEAAIEGLKSVGMTEEEMEGGLTKVGEADGYQFFLLAGADEEYAASLDEEYVEDYNNLPALIEKELGEAEYYAPVDAMKALEGDILSFTTTDLDGNTVTSEDLFKDNEITMVNLWGTWCHNCVDEMEELAKIHSRLQEKGCGIVGLEWEEKPGDETYQEARDLMKEKGTNYPNVLMPEGNDILSQIESFPTTFFVDREGRVLTKPIVGARVKDYEPTAEALLAGVSIPETELDESAASYTYRIFVTDEEDNPIEEAVVQFCDETSCRMGETDEDGCAVFEVSEAKQYEVHIAEAPDGFDYDEEEVFKTEDSASDLTIVLKKAE